MSTTVLLSMLQTEALLSEASALGDERRRIEARLDQINSALVASGEARVSMLRPGECDCLVDPRIRRRVGGAISGCPVHDPEHADERRAMLAKESTR